MKYRKPNNTARLKTLSPEKQDEIAEYALTHNEKATRAWLATEHKIKIGKSAYYRWHSWYQWTDVFRTVGEDTEDFMERVRESRPELSDGDIEALGNDFFQLQAVKQNNPEMFLKFRAMLNKGKIEQAKLAQREAELKQGEERLKLEQDKFNQVVKKAEAFERAQAALKENKGSGGLSPETIEKIERELKLL